MKPVGLSKVLFLDPHKKCPQSGTWLQPPPHWGLGQMESPTQTSPSWPMVPEVMAGGEAGRVRGRVQVRVQEQAWKPESSETKTLKAARQRSTAVLSGGCSS